MTPMCRQGTRPEDSRILLLHSFTGYSVERTWGCLAGLEACVGGDEALLADALYIKGIALVRVGVSISART